MRIDFHTHAKLSKKYPFSAHYVDWMFEEAKIRGLDAICLTEHFHSFEFSDMYHYISAYAKQVGDAYLYRGLLIFPGMETDIAEGGHVLTIGPMDSILKLQRQLQPYQEPGHFISFSKLIQLTSQYPLIIGAAHPFREGSRISKLSSDQLNQIDFFDLNGKDIGDGKTDTEELTVELAKHVGKPVVAGSDTHVAPQYGCIYTDFQKEIRTFTALHGEMIQGNYKITIPMDAQEKVRTASCLKRELKQIYDMGGDYTMALFSGNRKSKNTKENNNTTLVVIAGCAGSGKTSLGRQLAMKLGWTYIDKDTVTRDFTDLILIDKGHTNADRESELYCDVIRPVEYKITFKVCEENLRLGNSIILTAPLIAQIQDYSKWQQLLDENQVNLDNVAVKFIWISHDINREYTRINRRNAARDGYKLAHWEQYMLDTDGLVPDPNYHAYVFENDSSSISEMYLEDVLQWILK